MQAATTMTQPETVTFETTVAGSGGKTGIVIPEGLIRQLGGRSSNPGARPGEQLRLSQHLAVMAGGYMVEVNAAVRAATAPGR